MKRAEKTVAGTRESTVSAAITLIIVLITLVAILLLQTNLKQIEASLPVKISEQKSDITVLYQNLTDTVQSIRVHRYLPSHREKVLQDTRRLQFNLAQLRTDYTFDSLLGVGTFHAAISPAVQDVTNWLTLGLAQLPPDSPEVLELVSGRMETALAETNVLLLDMEDRARKILDDQAEAIGRFRRIASLVLGVVVLLTLLLIYYIVKQRRSRLALESRERQFRDFATIGTDYLWEMGPDLRFLWLSDGCPELIGLPNASVVGKTPLELWQAAGQEPPPFLKRSNLLESRQPVSDFLTSWQPPGAEQKVIRISARPVFADSGEFAGYRGVINDVTQLMEARSRARRLQREAEAASAAKTGFLSRISHEIRTPLTIVMGMIDRVESEVTAEHPRRTLDMMRDSAERMLLILNRVLDVSKIESGYFRIDRSAFNLRETLGFVVDSMQDAATQKQNTLSLSLPAGLVESRVGDYIRVEQVLRNLISNAIKATSNGTIVVSAESPVDGKSPEFVRFSVADTGVGIPADRLEAVFEPFVQHRELADRDRSGTGLGLHICRRMIVAMGGEIAVQSEPGNGSVFHFILPLSIGPIPDEDSENPISEVTDAGEPLQILLAEDDEIIQSLVADCFLDLAHELRIVGDGREALSSFQQSHFDLVLMDLQMPVMDGFEATRGIRKHETENKLEQTPIVALSASVLSEDVAACLEAGFTSHLSKPISQKALLALLNQHRG